MALSFENARALILSKVASLPAVSVPLIDSVGRVAAAEVRAMRDVPDWDNSAMDGFAVRAEDCRSMPSLQIDGYIPAGGNASGISVKQGQAVRIMTGAPVPQGCDSIVPIEETEEKDGRLMIRGRVKEGDHIRVRGEDVQKGAVVIAPGCVIRPAEINMLASFGLKTVDIHRRPSVAILSTGDELVEPGEPIGPGQIYNSNAYALAAAVFEVGGLPELLGIARDDQASLRQKMIAGLQADVLITSAGVSMGDRDLVCEVLEEIGVESQFWQVDIKPGKPTAFGLKDGKPVFSLPGNPVSSLVTFEQFVRPALLKMLGHRRVIKPYVKAVLQEEIKKKAGRVHFLRVLVTDNGHQLVASSAGDQNTGILSTLLHANGLAVLPADRQQFAAGEEVDIHLIDEIPDATCRRS